MTIENFNQNDVTLLTLQAVIYFFKTPIITLH